MIGSKKMINSRIVAAKLQKKTSVLISRLDNNVTSEDLVEYMRTTFGNTENYNIEEQKVRSGDYKSYRVEVRVELLDEILCPSNWPEDVLVKKFRFFRRTK